MKKILILLLLLIPSISFSQKKIRLQDLSRNLKNIINKDASAFTSLTSALSKASTDSIMIIVSNRQYITQSARDTLKSNAALFVKKGGRINVTKKFTIQGYFWAGNYQVFEGNLDSVEFVHGSIKSFNPKWFGNTFHATPSFPPDSVYTVNLLGKERKIWDKSSFSNAKNNYIESYGSFENFLDYGNLVRSSGGDSLIYFYVSGDNAKLYISTNEGRTWSGPYTTYTNSVSGTYIVSGTFGITSSGTWLMALERLFDSNDSMDVAIVLRSIDKGSTWAVTDTLTRQWQAGITSDIVQLSGGKLLFAYHDITSLAVYSADSSKIRVASSTDDGVNWSEVTAYAAKYDTFQLSHPQLNEPALAVDNNDSLIIVARVETYGSYLLKSGDLGATWNEVGMIGQTLLPAGTNLYNAASDVMTVNDSVFVLEFGHRTDGSTTKKGFMQILKATYREIKDDSYFGWTTLMPPTYVNGDPGSNRIILGVNDELILANGHTNEFYVITPEELSQTRSWLFEQNRYESNKYSVFVNSSFFLGLPWVIDNSSYVTIKQISYPFRVSNNYGANPVGAIPVLMMYYTGSQVNNPDSLVFQLQDQNGYAMQGMTLYITGGNSRVSTGWLPYIPTKTHTGGSNGQLGREEQPILIKAKSTNSSGYEITEFALRTGYIFK